MAKTRAQRKADQRARQAKVSEGQHDTQVPRSGDVAEVEAIERGIGAGVPESELETSDSPSRADRRAAERDRKAADRRRAEETKKKEREQLAKRQKQAVEERKRGRVVAFIISCWAELKKVQWPDRETLIQASAVTVVFVAVAAAYLGALDAFFNILIKQIL